MLYQLIIVLLNFVDSAVDQNSAASFCSRVLCGCGNSFLDFFDEGFFNSHERNNITCGTVFGHTVEEISGNSSV